MSKITNREIAQLAGVSPAAVSIAMNGKQGISAETRARILEIARQYHYCPNAASARILQGQPAFVAALFRTDAQLEDQLFYSEMSMNAMVACRDMGYTLVCTYITGLDGTIELPQAIRAGEVDGVLVFGDQEPGIYTELTRVGVPFVVLDCSRRNASHPAVFVDYAEAAYRATRHLIELGHRDIAYLSNGTLHDFNTLTLSGFQRATTEAGIALYPNRFQIDVEDEQSLRQCVDQALAGPTSPTAVFCTVDIHAVNVMRYLRELGFRVPEDISVIGIDDVAISRLVTPGLTTLRVDRRQMIVDGLQMLTALMQRERCESRTIAVPELICRQSTAPPAENRP